MLRARSLKQARDALSSAGERRSQRDALSPHKEGTARAAQKARDALRETLSALTRKGRREQLRRRETLSERRSQPSQGRDGEGSSAGERRSQRETLSALTWKCSCFFTPTTNRRTSAPLDSGTRPGPSDGSRRPRPHVRTAGCKPARAHTGPAPGPETGPSFRKSLALSRRPTRMQARDF